MSRGFYSLVRNPAFQKALCTAYTSTISPSCCGPAVTAFVRLSSVASFNNNNRHQQKQLLCHQPYRSVIVPAIPAADIDSNQDDTLPYLPKDLISTVKVQHDKFDLGYDRMVNKRGQELFCTYWKPKEKPRALVYVCHGLGEHMLWFHPLGKRLASWGCLAFGHDHVGHGRSEGSRVNVDSFEDYGNDVFQHVELMKAQYPDLPLYIVGHSMGGMVTMVTVLNYQKHFDGMVLTGPLLSLPKHIFSPFRMALAHSMSWLMPGLEVGKLNLWKLSRDDEMKQKVNDDPLYWKGGVKIKWGVALHRAFQYVSEHQSKVEIPFLVIHGGQDRLCQIKGSQDLYEKAQSKEKEFKVYPDAKHHLFIEVFDVRKKVLEDTVSWITTRLS